MLVDQPDVGHGDYRFLKGYHEDSRTSSVRLMPRREPTAECRWNAARPDLSRPAAVLAPTGGAMLVEPPA
jgi:hypothetical protein